MKRGYRMEAMVLKQLQASNFLTNGKGRAVHIIFHRCKNSFYVFYYFYKKTRFLFLERFLFSSGEIFYATKPAKILLNLLNFSIKRLLSDGFNIAVLKILS